MVIEMMNQKRIGAISAVVCVAAVAVTYVPEIVLERWTDSMAMPSWLPTFGTFGQTVTVYVSVIPIFTSLAFFGLAVWLGYREGDRVDLPTEYRGFIGAVAGGATVGLVVLLTGAAVFLGSMGGTLDPFSAGLFVLAIARFVAEIGVPLTVGALAGAALAEFDSPGGNSTTPAREKDDASSSATVAETGSHLTN